MLVTLFRLPLLLLLSLLLGRWLHVAAAPVASGSYLIANPDNSTGVLMTKFLDIRGSMTSDETPVIGSPLNSPNPSTSDQRASSKSYEPTVFSSRVLNSETPVSGGSTNSMAYLVKQPDSPGKRHNRSYKV
ncbi:hypothetical protein EXIGLDRAFT_750621 [Exidia glandulosa HHB12029]|uniref:Uncharacterized protein n=1 Tax=Exidia glandulosa HHB12029 TaxID=1314781 RepID=A0A165GHM9_EXIGL|nr:hypothetical protein EXIGLDRAFT_750621 [Exidia glandulosa HHB12029]